jgi:DNA-binding XRE family transcriptional regulator
MPSASLSALDTWVSNASSEGSTSETFVSVSLYTASAASLPSGKVGKRESGKELDIGLAAFPLGVKRIQLSTRDFHRGVEVLNDEYSPWEYTRRAHKIPSEMRVKKQVQPRSGPEKAFGDVLRTNRKKVGLSQERLAFESGFDRTTISLMERGLTSPTLRTMLRLCKLIHLSFTQLASQVEESRFYK